MSEDNRRTELLWLWRWCRRASDERRVYISPLIWLIGFGSPCVFDLVCVGVDQKHLGFKFRC